MPRSWRLVTVSMRWVMDRPRRSSRQTKIVSPARALAMRSSSTGRWLATPDAVSAQMCSAPAATRSWRWDSSDCLVVETRV